LGRSPGIWLNRSKNRGPSSKLSGQNAIKSQKRGRLKAEKKKGYILRHQKQKIMTEKELQKRFLSGEELSPILLGGRGISIRDPHRTDESSGN